MTKEIKISENIYDNLMKLCSKNESMEDIIDELLNEHYANIDNKDLKPKYEEFLLEELFKIESKELSDYIEIESENPNDMKIIQNKKFNDFLTICKNDKFIEDLIKERNKIAKNPYNTLYKSLKSDKCPKIKRVRFGDYCMVFYFDKKEETIYIIDLDNRTELYDKVWLCRKPRYY